MSFLFGESSEVASLIETLECIKLDAEKCLKNLSTSFCISGANGNLVRKPRLFQCLAVQPKRHFSRAAVLGKGKPKWAPSRPNLPSLGWT
jgi:hypothetical protein